MINASDGSSGTTGGGGDIADGGGGGGGGGSGRRRRGGGKSFTNLGMPSCGAALAEYKCPASPRRALVTLSTGSRSHFGVTKVSMLAYARRTGADFHVVDSPQHPALAAYNASAQAGGSSHFVKLPMLRHFLAVYDQVLFIDDDVLLSPFAPDLFAQVDCRSLGAVVEAYHVQGWHTMHAKSLCQIYGLSRDSCSNVALKRQRIFNSGVMLLSSAHRPLLESWDKEPLRCKILCDQLFMNAMLRKHGGCLEDLGTAFNLPGTQVRKMLTSTPSERESEAGALQPRDSPLADACVAHLTILPSKSVSAAYLLRRSLLSRDILQCAGKGGPVDAAAMLAQLPPKEAAASDADVQKLWCKGQSVGCAIVPAPTSGEAALPSPGLQAAAGPAGGAGSSGGGTSPLAALVPSGPTDELPEAALAVMRRAAAAAWDGKTVTLLFATSSFLDLALNWCQATRALGLRNFVLVAMDKALGATLGRFDAPPGLLLPRVASGSVSITKLNVIGERQRFGLRVLEAGFNVLFADLDAVFLRSPEPLLRDGDIIGERIWGRPRNVVKKWGAAICTGFYFLRATAANVAIFRKTQFLIAEKRQKQPRWQASDQWAINNALDQQVVDWSGGSRMKSNADFQAKYYDNTSHVGYTRLVRSKFVVLPHVAVARSCPVLKYNTTRPPASDKAELRKWRLWQHLLKHSFVLHCFPPDSMPCGMSVKHGEKGCDKSVVMGHPTHIHGEVVFDQRQGLWFMKEGWEEAIATPAIKDFWAWLESQYNGLVPGRTSSA